MPDTGSRHPQWPRSHPTDDDLEAHALDRLAEADAAPVDEHLLVCQEVPRAGLGGVRGPHRALRILDVKRKVLPALVVSGGQIQAGFPFPFDLEATC